MRRPAPSVEGSYEEIVSLLAGALTESSGKLSVIEDLSFSEGIDLSVGSVRFLGSVTVRGDVAAGIAVSGDKGVSISGDSRESRIESASGDVTVKGFLFGGYRGLVRAGRNCSVSVAHDATIEAIGDIFIEREAFGSTLRAGATVRGPRAKIRGGSLAVVCGIELFELGSSGGERVRVDLCSSNEVQREYVELVAKQQQVEQLLILARLHLGPLAVNPARIQLLSPTHRQKMAALHKRLLDLQLSAARLESQRKALAGGSTASPTMRVNILGTLFPGVVIHHAEERFSVQEPLRGPKSIDFDPTTGQFVVQELKALECSFSPQVQKKEKGR
jgi:uncharacterized protein (DUF342 family)